MNDEYEFFAEVRCVRGSPVVPAPPNDPWYRSIVIAPMHIDARGEELDPNVDFELTTPGDWRGGPAEGFYKVDTVELYVRDKRKHKVAKLLTMDTGTDGRSEIMEDGRWLEWCAVFFTNDNEPDPTRGRGYNCAAAARRHKLGPELGDMFDDV